MPSDLGSIYTNNYWHLFQFITYYLFLPMATIVGSFHSWAYTHLVLYLQILYNCMLLIRICICSWCTFHSSLGGSYVFDLPTTDAWEATLCYRLCCFPTKGVISHIWRAGLWPAGAIMKRNRIRAAILKKEIQSKTSSCDLRILNLCLWSYSKFLGAPSFSPSWFDSRILS